MGANLLLISEREEDVRFGEFIAFANDYRFHRAVTPEAVRHALVDFPQTVVFWDADGPRTGEPIAGMLLRSVQPVRVFAITDQPLNSYPYLFKYPAFGHHLFRRFQDPAPVVYSKLAAAAMTPFPFGLLRYFPEGTQSQRILITRSGQKTAAVEALQRFFTKQKVVSRLAALVAQASDELIMNAVFDAPVLPNGTPLRRGTDRGSDFELIEREHVRLEVASADDYIGISVSDQFGSLKKSVLLGFLGKDYQDQAYVLRRNDPGAGLGLHGIIQAGLSLLFISKPGVKTEVMIFFAKTENYKDFRAGFRFLSIITPL